MKVQLLSFHPTWHVLATFEKECGRLFHRFCTLAMAVSKKKSGHACRFWGSHCRGKKKMEKVQFRLEVVLDVEFFAFFFHLSQTEFRDLFVNNASGSFSAANEGGCWICFFVFTFSGPNIYRWNGCRNVSVFLCASIRYQLHSIERTRPHVFSHSRATFCLRWEHYPLPFYSRRGSIFASKLNVCFYIVLNIDKKCTPRRSFKKWHSAEQYITVPPSVSELTAVTRSPATTDIENRLKDTSLPKEKKKKASAGAPVSGQDYATALPGVSHTLYDERAVR